MNRVGSQGHPGKEGFKGPEAVDFDRTPFVAIWETTRACDLACKHCRAEAESEPLPGELDGAEGRELLTDLAGMGTPLCVLSGGDPAKRADLCELVAHGAELGMRMATIPAATDLLDRALVKGLKSAGLSQMALSLDGPNEEVHDNFRGVPGSFSKTMRGAAYARELELPLQINTTFSDHNIDHFEAIGDLVGSLGVVFWEVFFLVPTGRGVDLEPAAILEYKGMLDAFYQVYKASRIECKATCAPQFYRLLADKSEPVRTRGCLAGTQFGFVSSTGIIQPCGFLQIPCGDIREKGFCEAWAGNPRLSLLRDEGMLQGKCGSCASKSLCGGCRARAFEVLGDLMKTDPVCWYKG